MDSIVRDEKSKKRPSDISLEKIEALETRPRKKTKKLDIDLTMPLFIFHPEEEKAKADAEISAHHGRIRTLPVLDGHWPTHIYLQLKLGFNIESLTKSSPEVTKHNGLDTLIDSLSTSKAHWNYYDSQDLHISLARTFSLRHNEIDSFVKSLEQEIHSLHLSPIELSFDGWKLLENEQKTTSFLSLVSSPLYSKNGIDQVLALISAVDSVMEMFGHPVYYENPIVHASFAWAVSSPCLTLPLISGTISPPIESLVPITSIKCKIGKVIREWEF